mgnify:CR=1 FL=1
MNLKTLATDDDPGPPRAAGGSTVEVVTFGCRLNAYESEVIRRHAEEAGLAQTVIVNTCAVTGEAERQVRQTLRRLRRERPQARIVVTGCAAQIAPERYAAMPEVDAVWGNREKLAAPTFTAPAATAPRIQVGTTDALAQTPRPPLLTGFEGRVRAFVQVQQGCDHHCTFCIIPQGRGRSRSLEPQTVVAQVRRLVAGGYGEVVLSGVDIASYGDDFSAPLPLGQLVRQVLAAVPELPRLRLSSLDPAALDETLWAVLADEPRLMPHLHLSVQAGDDLILKRMRRRHDRAAVLAIADRARAVRPDVTLGADLIAGFPTEDEAQFAATLALVAEAELTWLHVFPYSPRPGTPAARMPAVPTALRRERAARLRQAGESAVAAHGAAMQGRVLPVLMETPERGRSEFYAEVVVSPPQSPGDFVPVAMTGFAEGRLRGEVMATDAAAASDLAGAFHRS